MTIRLRQWPVVAAAACALAGLAACSSDPAPDPGQSASATSSSGTAGPAGDTDSDAQQRKAGRQPQQLGNLKALPKTAGELGAPFDPCGLDWEKDFPEQVRPKDGLPRKPTPQEIPPDVQWDVECLYDNSGSTEIKSPTGGQPTVKQGALFRVNVAWAKAGTADPAKNPGSQPKEWRGRSGFIVADPPDPKDGERCTAAVRLQTAAGETAGSALITVRDDRFELPACDVANALAEVIAGKNQ